MGKKIEGSKAYGGMQGRISHKEFDDFGISYSRHPETVLYFTPVLHRNNPNKEIVDYIMGDLSRAGGMIG